MQDGGRAAVEAATTNVHVRVEVSVGQLPGRCCPAGTLPCRSALPTSVCPQLPSLCLFSQLQLIRSMKNALVKQTQEAVKRSTQAVVPPTRPRLGTRGRQAAAAAAAAVEVADAEEQCAGGIGLWCVAVVNDHYAFSSTTAALFTKPDQPCGCCASALHTLLLQVMRSATVRPPSSAMTCTRSWSSCCLVAGWGLRQQQTWQPCRWAVFSWSATLLMHAAGGALPLQAHAEQAMQSS